MYRCYYINNAVNPEDCDSFVDSYKSKEFETGEIKLDNGNQSEEEIRKSKILWIHPKHLMVRTVWSYILEANAINFKLVLDGNHDYAQLTKYDSTVHHYGWHTDHPLGSTESNTPIRKLSAILQLSKPEDYKGCDLQVFNGDREPEKPVIDQGSLTIFRSEEWHRITNLIEGERYSLVFWATGPQLI